MPTIQIVCNPVNAVIGKKGTSRVVGLSLDLNFTGAGTTLAGTAYQPAELCFWEAKAGADTQDASILFARLPGRVYLNGSDPIFDARREVGGKDEQQYIHYMLPDLRSKPVKTGPGWQPPHISTDWFVSLTFVSPQFVQCDHLSGENERLFLPWFPEAGEDMTLNVGTELRIGGKQEFFFRPNNVIDVGCQHAGVHIDGDPTEPTATFYGSGMVHPNENSIRRDFPATTGSPITCPTEGGLARITIHFHESVNSVVSDWKRVIGILVAQFQEIPMYINETHDIGNVDANNAGFVYQPDPANGGERTWMAQDPAGAPLPFFTFWVFYTHEVMSKPTAVGLEEGKIAVQAAGAASTKRVVYPVRLLKLLRDDAAKLDGAEQQDLNVANVIAHEIGHSLGLDHVLEAHPGAKGYVLPPSGSDVVRAVMAWENLGAFKTTRQRRFGPVHKSLLAREYL